VLARAWGRGDAVAEERRDGRRWKMLEVTVRRAVLRGAPKFVRHVKYLLELPPVLGSLGVSLTL